MAKKKAPSKAFIKELDELFKKHGWTPGSLIGFDAVTDEANDCTPPKTVKIVHFTVNGKDFTKKICV